MLEMGLYPVYTSKLGNICVLGKDDFCILVKKIF